MSNKRALFVGRFQPLHKGHKSVIDNLKDIYDLEIAIGSFEKSHTFENPLSGRERAEVLRNCFPDIETNEVPDVPSDREWTRKILEEIEFDFVVSGNSHTRKCFQNFNIEVTEPDFKEPERFKGENIRNRIIEGKEWKHLVPECALQVLEELNFEERVRNVS